MIKAQEVVNVCFKLGPGPKSALVSPQTCRAAKIGIKITGV